MATILPDIQKPAFQRTLPSVKGSGGLVASLIVKASSGVLFGISGVNTNAGTRYIQLFDAAALPADNAVPFAVIPVLAGNPWSYDVPLVGIPFTKGLVVCNSSTIDTKTIGAADSFFTAVYR